MDDRSPGKAAEAMAPVGLGAFIARTVIVIALVALGLALWRLKDVLSIAFGAIVLAVGFRGLADGIGQRTGLSRGLALAVVIVGVFGAVALAFEVFGAMMASQYDELSQKLPKGLHSFLAWLNGSPLGRDMVARSSDALKTAATGTGPRLLAGLVAGVGQALTYALVMIAGGVFLAIEPERYRSNFLALVPQSRRERYGEVLGALAHGLRRWLLARLVVMVAVGVLSSLGLWAMGIDAPFALGLTGAILTFIPYVGSVMAALPGMLIGFLQEPIKALLVALLFWAVHFIEGTFITPYAQDEAVDVPPVISIFSTVVFALLLGPVGVFLAAPITVVLILLVNHLYIEDVLGERVEARAHLKIRWPWRSVAR
ncbi:MAG: AI-2E family transporter [Caulobacteraceae bacterium]|nr:AI-2E family transporter [Caulobacteraceae bacterium]